VALFAQDDVLIRVVQYDGELDDVAKFMETWSARSALEDSLAPYITDEPAPEGMDFRTAWYRNNMRAHFHALPRDFQAAASHSGA